MDSLYAFNNLYSVYACFSVHRHNVRPYFHNCCISCLCRLPSWFFTKTHANLRDTIVYRDIKIYRSNVKTLRFLEKLRSAPATHFALQLGNQATNRFHFFPAAQLHIGIPLSGLISIFIKCVMCRVKPAYIMPVVIVCMKTCPICIVTIDYIGWTFGSCHCILSCMACSLLTAQLK